MCSSQEIEPGIRRVEVDAASAAHRRHVPGTAEVLGAVLVIR
ncbi:hypothetical protein [Streptomyces sp. SBT349]|nr:hypothetical protein [Streptomyces sp. SBT349]